MLKQGDLCYATVEYGCLGDLRELNSYKDKYDSLNEIHQDDSGDIFIFLRKDSVGLHREEVYVVYSIRCGKTGWVFTDEVDKTHYDLIE